MIMSKRNVSGVWSFFEVHTDHENVVTLSKYVLMLLDTRFPKDKDVANTKASKKTRNQKTRRDRAENIHQPLATQP